MPGKDVSEFDLVGRGNRRLAGPHETSPFFSPA
jgi:hypothetical protein